MSVIITWYVHRSPHDQRYVTRRHKWPEAIFEFKPPVFDLALPLYWVRPRGLTCCETCSARNNINYVQFAECTCACCVIVILKLPLHFDEEFKTDPKYKLCNLLVYEALCIKMTIRNRIRWLQFFLICCRPFIFVMSHLKCSCTVTPGYISILLHASFIEQCMSV